MEGGEKMKKFAALMMVAVLACSFMIGVFTTETQASNSQRDGLPPVCKFTKELVCNLDDCRVYELWACPWGFELVWTGDYCDAGAPCWGPFEQ